MKLRKLKMSAIFLLAMGGLYAQEAATASGGLASGSGGTLTYSLGQVAYSNISGTTGEISQGVQQPFEIFLVVALEEAKEIQLEFSSFPNPTSNLLHLQIGNFEGQTLSYQLYDLQGRLLDRRKILDPITTISLENLLPASYLLQVVDEERPLKTFRILKK